MRGLMMMLSGLLIGFFGSQLWTTKNELNDVLAKVVDGVE